MIPTTNQSNTLEGSLGGEQHLMSIDAENIPHLMGVLTDLYTDNELAPIREYSTNARDSHIMAGIDEPIRVSLPTTLRQTFEVQDFGLGLSVDEVVKVYGSYGASTKRGTNDANGCLGLGSKSALTYTNMFTVRAIKDGVQAEVAFFRDADGAGRIEVVDTKATDDRNGVTIVIPTKPDNKFRQKALRFYSVWEPGTVEVEGEDIDFILNREDAFEVNGSLIVPNRGEYSGNGTFIVMGNVAYSSKSEHDHYDNYKVYHFADMGAVDFVPSREGLNYTPRTEAYAEKVMEETSSTAVRAWVQSQVDTAKDLDEAYTIQSKYMSLSRYGSVYEWDGVNLDTRASIGNKTKRWEAAETDQREAWATQQSIQFDYAHLYAFCERPDGVSFSAKNKVQMRKLLEAKYPDVQYVVFKPVPVDTFLRFKSEHILWDEVKAIDVPRQKRGTKAAPAPSKYPTWRKDAAAGHTQSYERYEVIPDGMTIINGGGFSPDRSEMKFLRDNPDHVYVKVTDRRADKFARDFPNVKTWADIQAEAWKNLPDISEIEIDAWLLNNTWDQRKIEWMKKNDLLDDTLKEILAVDLKALAIKVNAWDNVGKYMETGKDYIDRTYPLFELDHPEHTRLYVEAVRNAQ